MPNLYLQNAGDFVGIKMAVIKPTDALKLSRMYTLHVELVSGTFTKVGEKIDGLKKVFSRRFKTFAGSKPIWGNGYTPDMFKEDV